MRTSWNNHETPDGLRALAADTWAELRDPGMWIDLIGSAIVTGGIALAIIAVLGEVMMGQQTTVTETDRPEPAEATITAFKGFDADLQCLGFQYEIGGSYEHRGKVVACPNDEQVARGEGGFHACEHPLNVFAYYPPATSRFAEVTLSGATSRHVDGTKIAAAKITINVELSFGELTKRAIDWVFARAKWSGGPTVVGQNEAATASGDQGAATASGDQGAATASGYQGAATASGRWGAATASGDQGAATASGRWGAATASGRWGAATASGRWGAATASGRWGAATASGRWGAATASGRWGAATASGHQGAATASGRWGAATASGDQGAATASGCWGAATASGYQGAATASGRWGAATASGRWGAATASGHQGAATASGRWGAATASGHQGAATASGDQGAATASGDQGAATASGDQGAATADHPSAVAHASGPGGKVRGVLGSAIHLDRRDDDGNITHVWAGIVGHADINPMTWYALDENGLPVECK